MLEPGAVLFFKESQEVDFIKKVIPGTIYRKKARANDEIYW